MEYGEEGESERNRDVSVCVLQLLARGVLQLLARGVL